MNSELPPLAAIFGLAGLTLTDAERAFFARVRPVGYILFARNIENPTQVADLVKNLRALTPDQNALVLIDQEGGRVQRLKPPHWRFAPAGAEFAALHGTNPEKGIAMTRLSMQLIGEELRALGIDVDCAPVMDVPVPGAHDVIGDRAYGSDPEIIATLATAAAHGLADAGVVPVIKHIPGHGRATSDSHKELPVVDADLATLRATDFVPFIRYCADKGAPAAFGMTAHVVYRAIDPNGPATTSKTVIHDVIRTEIGFQGLLMSDDLGMKALSGPFEARAEASLAAGCDVVLHCDGNMDDMEAVARGCRALDAQGLARLKAVDNLRGIARGSIGDVAAAEFRILNALRFG